MIRNWLAIVAQIAAVLYLRAESIDGYDENQSIRDHTSLVEAYKARNLAQLMALNEQINLRVAQECRRSISRQ